MRMLKLLQTISRKKQLIILSTLLFLFSIIFLFSFSKTFAQSTPSMTVNSNVYFCLSPYNTEINFQSQQSVSSVRLDNSSWYWYFGDYGFQVENANMTITNFFGGDRLEMELNGTGTSTTKIYLGSRGEPSEVSGASSWSYNGGTNTITINVIHSSWTPVWLEWSTVSDWVGIVLPYGYMAVGLMSLSMIIVVGVAILVSLQTGNADALAPIMVLVIGILIVLFVAVFILGAFNTL